MLRPLHLVLIALLLVLQAQLWFGRGSIPDVMRLRQTLTKKREGRRKTPNKAKKDRLIQATAFVD